VCYQPQHRAASRRANLCFLPRLGAPIQTSRHACTRRRDSNPVQRICARGRSLGPQPRWLHYLDTLHTIHRIFFASVNPPAAYGFCTVKIYLASVITHALTLWARQRHHLEPATSHPTTPAYQNPSEDPIERNAQRAATTLATATTLPRAQLDTSSAPLEYRIPSFYVLRLRNNISTASTNRLGAYKPAYQGARTTPNSQHTSRKQWFCALRFRFETLLIQIGAHHKSTPLCASRG